jgi:hypothetical protein
MVFFFLNLFLFVAPEADASASPTNGIDLLSNSHPISSLRSSPTTTTIASPGNGTTPVVTRNIHPQVQSFLYQVLYSTLGVFFFSLFSHCYFE